ncbi:multi-sensor signal transduction histidine kinase [Haloterrigena turkmenica DSM 5511]|uniref:histidine kinase n=1 Tax=Haloterrigena turkmenica (strain ATCC 51198 / DSM 5511 / JCM 9101 / NCIMB 13204 / VKM B-1734 / 4k) TaxID=543526 RepID=D2RPK9_HALTV|nr:PAS domain S-box protein [Haloterrigena turkmenica]ADB62161.1 multi-sensor signal transduction histidine kinase [Haloterrigena turkmenica DSM 5511]
MPSRAVLYVDPDETARRRLSRDLAAGAADPAIDVEGVATAAALRDALADESSAYACVVTEYRLDGLDADMDALTLYDSLRADGLATVPFVLYTADGSETLASEAITAGFSGYVPKGRTDSVERLREQLRAVTGLDANRTIRARTDQRAGPRGPSQECEHEQDLERYRTLVETVGDSMYVLDESDRIEMANEAMADAFETTREQLRGRPIDDFVAAEDAGCIRSTLEEVRAIDGRAWKTVDLTVEVTDGTTCDAEVNVAPLVDADGTLTGSVGVIRDVSERAKREWRIRRLHDGTRRLMAATETDEIARIVTEIAADALDLDLNAVYLYEPNVLTRSASRASGESTDGDARSDATDEERGGLVPVAMSDRMLELFDGITSHIEPGGGIAWDAYEAGEEIVHGDVRQTSNVRNPETPIRSEAHVPLGDHGIFIASSLEPNDFDPEALTLARILAANAEAALDRAERESELAEHGRELERQNERLEAFASTVSHDLRNPLALATGHLDLLTDRINGDGETDRHVEEIEWALARMDALIENVLTLARSGRRLTETEPVDLAAVVERAERTTEGDLEVVWDGALPTVDGDEERLCVLFENVFRNAVEHGSTSPDSHALRAATEQRSETVTVTIEPTIEGFAIADDGSGIPPGDRDRVLEWGYSTDAEGTGFGLAIVTEVVEAHGWSVVVEESDAGGLRLAVSIPP